MKKTLITIGLLLSLNVSATENKEDYQTFTNEKYTLDIHDSISGGIISIFNLVKGHNPSITNNTVETKIEYQDNPETQAKLAKFKDMLNAKLQSNELSQTFYFKTANATLSDKQINYLSNVVLSLNDYEGLKYTLKGFSDTRGNPEYNKELSLSRIETVSSILNQLNINSNNITFENKGEADSEQNAGYEDLFFDRKVELIITK
jgi:outer membrane protein OmpA-like peptidoglycan-associated protein